MLEGRIGREGRDGAGTTDDDYVALRKSLKQRPVDHSNRTSTPNRGVGGDAATECGLYFYQTRRLFASDCRSIRKRAPATSARRCGISRS